MRGKAHGFSSKLKHVYISSLLFCLMANTYFVVEFRQYYKIRIFDIFLCFIIGKVVCKSLHLVKKIMLDPKRLNYFLGVLSTC